MPSWPKSWGACSLSENKKGGQSIGRRLFKLVARGSLAASSIDLLDLARSGVALLRDDHILNRLALLVHDAQGSLVAGLTSSTLILRNLPSRAWLLGLYVIVY